MTWTATAPEAVLTVRTHATRQDHGSQFSAHILRLRRQTQQLRTIGQARSRTNDKSQVRQRHRFPWPARLTVLEASVTGTKASPGPLIDSKKLLAVISIRLLPGRQVAPPRLGFQCRGRLADVPDDQVFSQVASCFGRVSCPSAPPHLPQGAHG